MKVYDRVVFDLEANGLLDTANTVWCLVIKSTHNGARMSFSDYSDQPHVFPLATGLKMLSEADVAICHNVLLYDSILLNRLFPKYNFDKVKFIDTLILSQVQNFNRPLSQTWGRHGLDAWGKHFNRFKPTQALWDTFDEHMIHRCEEDVEINYLTYRYLVKENQDIHMSKDVVAREMYTAIISQQQVNNGWLLNKNLARKHVEELDNRMEKLRAKIEPNLPQRLIKPSQAMTWEEVNASLKFVFKKVPLTRSDMKGRILKPAKAPSILKYTRAGLYPATMARWFDIEPDNAKETKYKDGKAYNASLIEGPYTRIKWELSRMSQHEQVKKFLFTQGWVPTTWNFKKDDLGNFIKDSVGRKVRSTPKLTEDSFDSVKGELGQEIATYNTYSSRRKVIKNPTDYSKGWLNNMNSQGRIVCYPRTMGAATARMTHGGVVNVPGTKSLFGKEMREVFIASPGYKIVACDMASAQLRLLAAAMGDAKYMHTVVSGSEKDENNNYIGTDIHSVNGLAAGLIPKHATPGSEEWKTGRSNAKTFIYALLFGAGNAKIGTIVNGTAADGELLRKKFLKGLPALGRLIDKLTAEWKLNKSKGDGWFKGLDGRRIYCNSPHKILNYKLQSDEAILLKQWMINVDTDIKADQSLEHARLLLSYHDELNFETVPNETDTLGKILKKGIQDAGKQFGIDIMDGEYQVGDNWAEVH